jgi:hypothetical protein
MNLHPIRTLPLQALHQSPDGSLHHHLQSLPPGLQNLDAIAPDPSDGIFHRYLAGNASQQQHALHAPHPFGHHSGLPHPQNQFHGLQPSAYPHAGNRFNVIAAPPQQFQAPPAPPPQPVPQRPRQISKRIPELEPQPDVVPPQEADDAPVTSNHGQFEGLKLIADPPNLEEWREKLFHVDDTITLTEDEYVLCLQFAWEISARVQRGLQHVASYDGTWAGRINLMLRKRSKPDKALDAQLRQAS